VALVFGSFADQTGGPGTMRFSWNFSDLGVTVDKILAVPEPGMASLLSLGGLMLKRKRRRSHSCKDCVACGAPTALRAKSENKKNEPDCWAIRAGGARLS